MPTFVGTWCAERNLRDETFPQEFHTLNVCKNDCKKGRMGVTLGTAARNRSPRASQRTRSFSPLALGVVGLLALGSPALASTVLRLTNAELVKRAEVIVHGKCTGAVPRAGEDDQVVTDVTLSVSAFLKAPQNRDADGKPVEAPKTFTFTTLGGRLADRGFAISGFPTFEAGEEVVLFLDVVHPKTKCRTVVGLSQGKFTVKADAATGTRLVTRDLGGVQLVDEAGKPVAVDGAFAKLSLDALLSEIKSSLGKK